MQYIILDCVQTKIIADWLKVSKQNCCFPIWFKTKWVGWVERSTSLYSEQIDELIFLVQTKLISGDLDIKVVAVKNVFPK